MRVIVVGINHAGTNFIKALKAFDKNSKNYEIIAYDRNSNISFLGCGMSLWLDRTINDPKVLFYASPEALAKSGVTVKMNHDILKIDTDRKTLEIKNLQTNQIFTEHYDKLVYAAGSSPIELGLPNEKAKNVFYAKLYQNAAAIVEASNKPNVKDVAIIGAGYIGVEFVEAFNKIGKKVHLIEVQDEILKSYFDSEFTAPLAKTMTKAGVEIHLNTKVEAFEVNASNELTKIKTSTGSINAQVAILASGFKPNSDLLTSAEKSKRGHVKVDGLARVIGVKDVYALGDVASYFHAVTNEHLSVGLATNAIKSALAAAADLAHQKGLELSSVVGTNGISIFGTNYAATGLCAIAAEKRGISYKAAYIKGSDLPEFMPKHGEIACKILYDPASLRLIGAQIASTGPVNHSDAIFLFALALQKGLKITELLFADLYFLPHYNAPVNFIMSVILKALDAELK